MSSNIRIRTEPNGSDKHIKIQLNQDFDFLEILSLKISQEDIYRTFYSDYGVVVGRIIMNSGVGVPNVKVSIFIPLTDDDAQDEEISSMYPYSDISIVNTEGIRYNVLPKDSQDECHTPVGTFPSKKDLLDNDRLMTIYDKYYKYTATTNDSGDFMIFGVPIGNYTLNVDADLSDIGIYSQRPYDFIEQGNPSKLFDSPTKFKKNVTLNSLTQLRNRQIGINVMPFWGEEISNEIGITRIDVDLNYELIPKAIFIGSIFGDNEKNSLNKNCRPGKKIGKVCEMAEGGGTVQMLRKTQFGDNEIFNIEGGKVINDNGAWAYQIPMNLDYKVTDEYGNLVPTEDTTQGIPTRSSMRFKISMDEVGGEGRLRTRANYLVPHNPSNTNEINYSFDESTPNIHFRDFYWNKIYTIKNFVSRFQRDVNIENRNFIGFKDVDDCVGTKNPLPYNTMDTDVNPLYTILCLIVGFIIDIFGIINTVISILPKLFRPSYISFTCPINGTIYYPRRASTVAAAKECFRLSLAEILNVYELDFYNEWLNGSLYAFLLKYKKVKKEDKFCGDDGTNNNYLIATNPDNPNKTIKDKGVAQVDKGPIVSFKGELFYKPLSNNGNLVYGTDIFNLGSVFKCDWQGISNIVSDLIPTSYQLPEYTDETNSTTTITDLLFKIDCFGVTANSPKSRNIRRLCEVGIGIDEDSNYDINNNDITNEILRRNLIKLNNETYKDVDFVNISSNFDSDGYKAYRGLITLPGNTLQQSFGNSYYFYFGTAPNKTAIDLMNGKYFTTCTKPFKNPINIVGDINDVLTVNGSSGSITITVRGGTPTVSGTTTGYTIEWSTGDVDTLSITGLTEGTYTVSLIDGNGQKSIKTFIVRGIKPLSLTTRIVNAQTTTTNNGSIIIDSIIGGIGPYDVVITGSLQTYIIDNVVYGTVLNNIGVGSYSIQVSDSSLIPIIVNTNVVVSTPQPLTINNLITSNVRCYEGSDGVISFTIQGGTPSYIITLSGTLTNGGTYISTSNNNTNLEAGTYNLSISDGYNQAYTHPQIVITEPIANLSLTKEVGSPFYLTNTVSGTYYNLLLNNVIINTVLATGGTTDLNNVTPASGDYVANNNFNCQSNGISI
jgi:hypothetical protein